ncbi:MAG: hypothetical protein NT068_00200 [Candidatus Nomurabacteria bacterium]|nr:hypothetical protein [Candidatus Nomurabacteria bacterium]
MIENKKHLENEVIANQLLDEEKLKGTLNNYNANKFPISEEERMKEIIEKDSLLANIKKEIKNKLN